MPELIAAIDVGTTGARTIIFDIYGKVVETSYCEYPIITPQPGFVEQDANQWWQAVLKTSKTVFKSKKIDPNDILAIAVTNQRETIVPVDQRGKALHNAIVWQDRRTTKQCQEISDKVGKEKIYQTTGLTIDPYFSASKLMWINDNEPDIFKLTHKFLLVHDYIVHKLTDEFYTDYSNAARTMLFDIKKFKWNEGLCELLGIPIEKLPTAEPSGKIIGQITKNASEVTGFILGTPVVTGGGDQQCAALGLGVIHEGLVKATTGTGSFVLAHLNQPKFDTKMRIICSVSVIPEQWVLEASIFTTGAIYRWFRDNFAELDKKHAEEMGIDVYEFLNKEVENAEPGARGLLLIPHFAGAGAPYWNPDAKGLLYGLTLAHDRRDIIRSIIEGVCFEIRKTLEVFSELGLDISELRIAGGGAKATVWNQIQADIYGLSIAKTALEETTALGAAIIGCVGIGRYRSYDDAVKNIVRITDRYKPNNELKELYDAQYLKNKELYKNITKLFTNK